MKVAFIFDTKLIKKEENFFAMTLTYDFLKDRYLKIFDEIVISTRVENKKNVNENGYEQTNGNGVEVRPIYSYKEIPDAVFKRRKIYLELKEIIDSVDKVIIRMPSVLGIIACDICNRLGKDYIIEMVACAWDGYVNHTNIIGKLIAPIMYFMTKKYVYIAPNVIYVTDYFLQKRYPSKGKTCACSDVALLKENTEVLDNRIEKINKMSLECIKIATVANVALKYKGHKYVFKALSKLKNKAKYEYYLVGNGNQKRLKKLAEKYNIVENVKFLGSIPHEEVFNILDEVDIYIQPSLQEGMPRAIIEAMSRALPILGSDCGGIPELISKEAIFKKKGTYEIINILKKIDKVFLIKLAKTNYVTSKRFEESILNEKRQEILKEFTKE